jgi:hypothetical protein
MKMRAWSIVAAVIYVASAVVVPAAADGAADRPYAGTWRLNPARSDFGETTVTYAITASGEMQMTAAGQSYRFRMDGKDYPSLFGGTSAWTRIDDTTWEVAIKLNGKRINTTTTTVSADGETLTTNETGPKPTGGTFVRKTTYARASGGPGLVGIWKTKNPPRMPRIVEIVPSGTDGLAIRFPDDQESCQLGFDGKDYRVTGPIAKPAMTLAIPSSGPRSIDVTGKQDGKPIFEVVFSVSEDGQTLTQAGAMLGAGEEFVAVYDRQ